MAIPFISIINLGNKSNLHIIYECIVPHHSLNMFMFSLRLLGYDLGILLETGTFAWKDKGPA